MRGYIGLGLVAATVAIVVFAWTRDGGDDGGQRSGDEPQPSTPSTAAPPQAPPRQPPRVMPRQRPVPRTDMRSPVPPAAEERIEAHPAVAAPPPPPPSAPAPRDENPELTRRVETAKQLFDDHDFEATSSLAQESLQLYPESFWLRSLAVKSLCAMGNTDRAKELIAEEPRTSQRKRLRVHCRIQTDRWQ